MEAFAQFVPLILIFAIMYFLLIRPQQRKLKDHKKMVESLRRGDMIVTQGGLIGKVKKVKEDKVEQKLFLRSSKVDTPRRVGGALPAPPP